MESFALISNTLSEIKTAFAALPSSTSLPYTYFSQWESPKLVQQFISKKIPVTKDPLWKRSGATSAKDYEYWSWNLCGIACLRMVLSGKKLPVPPAITLAKESVKFGCYTPEPHFIGGLFYKPFITFLNQKFGLKAQIANPLSIHRIKYLLAQNCYLIASVNPAIRFPNSSPLKKGGHLVLITGYDQNNKSLVFQNPSGFYSLSQENVPISETSFAKFFARRGIVIY
jgi:hypothetical protein